MKFAVFVAVLCFIAYAGAETPVQRCPQGKSVEEYKEVITVGNCKKPPCRLRKGHTIHVEFKFTPDRDVKKLTNTVNAIIVGLPFPFIGVDNMDACPQLYESDGTTKASCPLKAGTQYIYKNQFDMLSIYPILKVVVHWGLTAEDGQDVMCFHVPAKITN